MTVAAFYDEGRYGQSYYDNQNPAELIELTDQAYSTTISEQVYTINLSDQAYTVTLSDSEIVEEA